MALSLYSALSYKPQIPRFPSIIMFRRLIPSAIRLREYVYYRDRRARKLLSPLFDFIYTRRHPHVMSSIHYDSASYLYTLRRVYTQSEGREAFELAM